MRVGSLERDQPISAGETLKHTHSEYLQCFGAVGAGFAEVQEGSRGEILDSLPGEKTLEGPNVRRVYGSARISFVFYVRFQMPWREQRPEAGRPGCLLFLRREESLEVTA
jgi:hypothetical protein